MNEELPSLSAAFKKIDQVTMTHESANCYYGVIHALLLNFDSMKIRPVGDRVVLKFAKEQTKTDTGLYLPDTADKEKPEQATVVAVGQGEEVAKLELKKGMTVLFGKYSGSEVDIDGQEYKVVSHEDILAVIEWIT